MTVKFSDRIAKNTIILVVVFSFILFFATFLFFGDFKDKSILTAKTNYELNIEYFNEQFKDKLLLLDRTALGDLENKIKKTDFIKNVKIEHKKYLFDKKTLLHHTMSFSDDSWSLTAVETDIKFGEIKKLNGNSLYEFTPSLTYDKKEDLIIRYQLLNDGMVRNFITNIDLKLLEEIERQSEQISFPFWFEYFYNTKLDSNIKKELKINNVEFATVEYIIDDYLLKLEIYKFIISILIYVIIISFPIFLLIFFYQNYLQRKYVSEPIHYLDKIVSDVLEYKFVNIDMSRFENIKDYSSLVNNISKLSNKIASLINELNINKESLERNMLTDNLTGLFDKKMFDIDMKSMFVSSGEGYVFSLKISKLYEIVALNGSVTTDSFILSYANIISNSINSYRDKNIDFYRFYASEFAIIARDINYEAAVELSEKIINNLIVEVSKNYKLPDNAFHIGGAPFDIYGTTDSIMKLANDAHEEAKNKNYNCSVIVHENKIAEEVHKLENEIKIILENNSFGIDFIFDSFSYENNKLVMQELKPILKDRENKDLPIGSFIAVCEKLELNVNFDENIILKVLSYIQENQIEHKIAINLSVKTIHNIRFIDFLKNLSKENLDLSSHIIFSITSYAASTYKTEFKEFVKEMNELNIGILIKRFKTKEFPIEELAEINIDYLRIDRDLTQNIYNDLIKKHKIKNIVIYGEINNVKILTDMVSSNKDYEYLSRLDLYATSR